MKTNKSLLLVLLTVCCLIYSCADVQPQVAECVVGHQYGFWGGLWHGMIAPISFIGYLFSDNIDVYAINNNGGWYTFGFVLGAGILSNGVKYSYDKTK